MFETASAGGLRHLSLPHGRSELTNRLGRRDHEEACAAAPCSPKLNGKPRGRKGVAAEGLLWKTITRLRGFYVNIDLQFCT
jgi:hypothetical protein